PTSLAPQVDEQLGKPPRTLRGIETILEQIRPTRTDLLWIRANDAYDNGLLKDAVRFLDALIDAMPTRVDAFYARAKVKYALLDVYGALKDYDKAITLDDSNVDIFLDRGQFYEQMGFLDRALADYE